MPIELEVEIESDEEFGTDVAEQETKQDLSETKPALSDNDVALVGVHYEPFPGDKKYNGPSSVLPAASDQPPATEAPKPEPASELLIVDRPGGETALRNSPPLQTFSNWFSKEEIAAEAQWEESKEALEREISDLTIERIQLAERAKSIKKRIDCLAEELSELREQGPEKPCPKPPEPVSESSSAAEHVATASEEQRSPGDNAPQVPNDAWRSAPLVDLGLKKNVQEKLTEASVETIGQLEDLRAAISLGKKEWPKGIGKAKITEIEDAVITWLTKNRDSAVFQSASTSGVPTPMSPEVATTTASPDPIPTNEQWDEWTDAQRSIYLTERAVALSTNEKDGLQKALDDSSYWESGRGYFGRGSEIIDCPYTPGAWQDDWIRGYLSADLDGQVASDIADDPEESLPSSEAPEVQPELTLADL